MSQENFIGNAASADRLAQSIVSYWASKGKRVKAWIETTRDNGGKIAYEVKTDLVNGMPQRRRA